MKKNGGITLIELIVVIAILVVISGGFVSGIASLTGAKVSRAQKFIVTSLQETRIDALSKSSAYFSLSYNGTNKEYNISNSKGSSLFISDRNLEINCELQTDTGTTKTVVIDSSNLVALSFQRGTGGFYPAIASVSDEDNYIFFTDEDGNYFYCKEITITSGTRSKSITLVKDTGKVKET